MKKRCITIGTIAVIVVVISIYLLVRPKLLGNMNHSYTKETTTTSDISFLGDAGDKIKFSFKSNIENGDLDMFLYNSEGNVVYELDRAKELECFFTLDNSDTYTLAAKCSNYIGKYKIKVYKVKE
ncbi:MAG: hypothetical protein K2N51_08125 [Lachnospiraceae bacterium]|nr:hypothetical protein [Lachnospiraceae bacterium]